jgi:hypothetical protein
MSEADEYELLATCCAILLTGRFRLDDPLDAFVPDELPPPAAADLLALGPGFANALGGVPDPNGRDVPAIFWHGPLRSNRRRGNGTCFIFCPVIHV